MDMPLFPGDAGPEASALRYGNLLLLERPAHVGDLFSRRHPRMTRLNRAKLFAPFAALAGFEECVRRKEAEYVYRREPDGEEARALDRRLCELYRLTANSGLARANGVRVRVERFQLCRDPDSEAYLVKGQYVAVTGTVVRVDPQGQRLLLRSEGVSLSIPFRDIRRIDDAAE